jgi:hypothetical protein
MSVSQSQLCNLFSEFFPDEIIVHIHDFIQCEYKHKIMNAWKCYIDYQNEFDEMYFESEEEWKNALLVFDEIQINIDMLETSLNNEDIGFSTNDGHFGDEL